MSQKFMFAKIYGLKVSRCREVLLLMTSRVQRQNPPKSGHLYSITLEKLSGITIYLRKKTHNKGKK